MANNTQTFTGRVLLDDKQAQRAIAQLSKDLEQVRIKRKEALSKGNDVKEFDHQIKQISASINALKTNQQQVNDTLGRLSSASYKELSVTMRTLQKQLRSGAVERNSEEWKMLQQRLKEVKREMNAINNESKEATSAWGRTINWLNTNWGAITQIIGAISGLSFTVRKCINAFADMEESMANVRKYTGQTDEQVHQMNEDFKRMDTRTAREQLNELAGSAGRLGITSKEMIKEFVDGADKINVALGDDLGEGAVDKIGKLAQMFGEDKTKGLRGAMLATGSAVNELAQNSSANAGYIVDFTADLSGVGIQAGMTQAQIMGLASALDQNMQEEATSATVFSQLITKMYQEPAKFAKIAGMEVKKFSTLMKTDANEGLMKFMQAMKSKGGFAEMAPMFEEMQLNGTRAVGVLSAVASHLDQVKTAQDLATQSYAAGTSVLDEFNVQNNTVQAKLDKAKKSFQDLTIELGQKLQPMAILCISTASVSVKILSVITEFVYKFRTTLITLTATIIALTIAENAHAMKLKIIAFWQDVVVTGCKKLWATLLAHPYVAVAGAAAMLVAVIVDLTRKTDTATEAQKELNDIRKQAAKDIVGEKEKLENLRRVAKDEHQSLKDRYTAIAELNKIVPGYNASIDKTTGKYKENKKALDNYIKSLVRLYEIQGAKKKIQQLSEGLVDLRIKEKDAQRNYDNAKKAGAGVTYTTSWGSVGNTTQDATSHYKGILDSIKKDKAEREALINSIKDAYGDDIRKQEVKDVRKKIEQNTPASSTHTMTEKERKAAEKAKKKQEAEARKAAVKRKADLKKELDDAKKSNQAEQLETTTQYSTGQIRLAEYNDHMAQIKEQGLQQRMDILKKYGEAESEEYKRLNAEKEKIAADYDKKQTSDLEAIETNRQTAEMNIRANYYNKKSDIYHDEDALNEALFLLDQNYLDEKQELYLSSSDEYWQIEKERERSQLQHQYERQEQYDKTLMQLKQEYLKMGNEEQMKLELKGLDEVHKAGLVSEEEYQRMKMGIANKYASYKPSVDDQRKDDANTALDTARKMSKPQDDHGTMMSDNIGSVIGGAMSAVKQQKMVNDNLDKLRAEDQISEQAYQDAKKQMNKETYNTILSVASAAFSSMSGMMSAASAYSQACSDLEVAKIEKNYDKQINAAGNNSAKKKKLEEKRDKEIAKAKTKANKKAMVMELAQALAQTATGAISAYSSTMAGAPYPANLVLAPISAGIALAAGMLQVATIKKQHQAEAAGYYEGGFTGPGSWKKEAGVVHAGEFVANHNAVSNPQLLPALKLIDAAQRNNTVASLTAQDVSRAMGGGGAAVVAPVVNVSTDNEQVTAALDGVSATIDLLNQQLNDGIQAEVVIMGRNGFARKWKDYNKMLDNK